MGYLIYNNQLLNNADTITVTPSSGTITDTTSNTKMLTRQLADKYTYSNSSLGTITFAFTLLSVENVSSVALLGVVNGGSLTISTITLYSGATNLGTATFTEFIKSRFDNGEYLTDDYFVFDATYSADKIEIKYSTVDTTTTSIGSVFVGVAIDIPFSLNANYTQTDTSTKDRSNGGQVYANTGQTYSNLSIDSSALTHQETYGTTGSINDFNIVSGTSEPIILIPHTSENLAVYGTQKTISKITTIQKNTGGEWFWKASFKIEEEL